MAQVRPEITYKSIDTARLPDAFTEGASLLMDLSARGAVTQVGEQLRIRRQGGYCGLDAWVFLLLFFAAGAKEGVKSFWERARPHAGQLAALFSRKTLPGTASLSRVLDDVEVELLRPVSSFLLLETSGLEPLLQHPAVLTYDGRGEGWHVFDLDPTVTTLRHRALPCDEALPEPRRRAAETGAPGYSGRKRGDLQFRRVTVQHAGSSAWVHAHLSSGNGEGVKDYERAFDAIAQTALKLRHPLSRVLVRMDGEAGHVPYFTAARERGLPFISRLNRAKLYEAPALLTLMRQVAWYRVPDSLAGPQRSAAELGIFTIEPGERTKRADGRPYEPIRVRVVASRFPKHGDAKRGHVLDGWQVELFAVDVPAEAFPAPEAVAEYFGRSGQENRFAQEDRELGLDRIVSYHLPGQELAVLIGLSLWNMRVARGFRAADVPATPPASRLRQVRVDERADKGWPRDPVIARLLGELPWEAFLKGRPGWHWDAQQHELQCDQGRVLALTSVRPVEPNAQRTGIILRRATGGCQDCPSRDRCLKTSRENAAKHLELSVPTDVAKGLSERLALIRSNPQAPCRIEPVTAEAGTKAVTDALFLPASARQLYRSGFSGGSLRVTVSLPQHKPSHLRLVAADAGERQRRRKTWAQRLEYNAAPEGTRLSVEAEGSSALHALLGKHAAAAFAAGYG